MPVGQRFPVNRFQWKEDDGGNNRNFGHNWIHEETPDGQVQGTGSGRQGIGDQMGPDRTRHLD